MAGARGIEGFLAEPAIAVVGVSRSGKKFGNAACRTLRDRGYRVYLVHRDAETIDGMKCYPRLSELPERVESVLVVVPPAKALDVIRDAAAAGIHHVWLQQGAESPEAVELAATLPVDLVTGECVLMFAQPTGIHKLHRAWRRFFGTLPA